MSMYSYSFEKWKMRASVLSKSEGLGEGEMQIVLLREVLVVGYVRDERIARKRRNDRRE